MTEAPKIPAEWKQAIMQTLACRVNGDIAGAIRALDTLCDYGDQALYLACCGWAEAVNLFALGGPGPASYSVEVVGPLGTPIEPEDGPPEQAAQVWAGRFIAAQANDDSDTTLSLFRAARHAAATNPDSHIGRGVFYLLDMAAAATRESMIKAMALKN